MLIIESYSTAIIMCIITMICWGSWANTMKLTGKKWTFQLFYWDYSLGVQDPGVTVGLLLFKGFYNVAQQKL